MELWRYYRILKRSRWLILIGVLTCVGVVGGMIYFSPQNYEATSTILEKSAVNSDPVNVYSQYGGSYGIDPRFRLSTLSALMQSQVVLQRTAMTLYTMNITTDPATILRTVSVSPIQDTGLIGIKVVSDSAEVAKATVDTLVAEFLRFYSELNGRNVADTKALIQKELPQAKQHLSTVREELRKFKEQDNAVMVPRQLEINLTMLSQYQQQYSQEEMAARQSQARINECNAQLSRLPEFRVVGTTVATNPIWQSLQQELLAREVDLDTMLRDRTPEHPEVKTLQRRVDETKQKLRGVAEQVLANTSKSPDPVHDTLRQQYAQSLVDQASANVGKLAILKSMSPIQTELRKLPKKEMELAQLTVEEDAAKNTYELLRQKLDEATVKENEAQTVSDFVVADAGSVDIVRNKTALKLGMAAVLGLIACSVLALLLDYMDNTVKSPVDAEKALGLPVLSSVPIMKRHILFGSGSSAVLDSSYQMLSLNLDSNSSGLNKGNFLVASSSPSVGRSTTAANTAVALARDGYKVVLVDADMRFPAQHSIFQMDNSKGLSNVLTGQLSAQAALQETTEKGLSLIPSGPIPTNPVRLLRSPEMAGFLSEVSSLADFVVFDSPAGTVFADGIILAGLIKTVIIVQAAGSIPRGAETDFIERIRRSDANILGVVLNGVDPEVCDVYHHFKDSYEFRGGK
jgi:capsular exopolysaccharide synthesis family protein